MKQEELRKLLSKLPTEKLHQEKYASLYEALSVKGKIFPEFETKDEEESIVPVCQQGENSSVQIAALPLTDSAQIKTLPKRQFELWEAKRRNIDSYTWTRVNYISKRVMVKHNKVFALQNPSQPIYSDSNFLKHYGQLPKLVLVDMGIFGIGVAAGEFISQNHIVTFYAGHLIPWNSPFKDNTYVKGHITKASLDIPVTIENGMVKLLPVDSAPGLTDAKFIGGYASFMLHLPEKSDLPGDFKSQDIATENVSQIGGIYQNFPALAFIANRDIKMGELVGFCYYAKSSVTGIRYSGNGEHPALFTRTGGFTLFRMDPITKKVESQLPSWDKPKFGAQTKAKTTLGFLDHRELVNWSLLSKHHRDEVSGVKKQLAEELGSSARPNLP